MDIEITKLQLNEILTVLLNEKHSINLYDASEYHVSFLYEHKKIPEFVDECFYEKNCTILINSNNYIELSDEDGVVMIESVSNPDIRKMINHFIG